MITKIINAGLTIANIISLFNNNQESDTKQKRQEVYETNKKISNFRNIAYTARRFLK